MVLPVVPLCNEVMSNQAKHTRSVRSGTDCMFAASQITVNVRLARVDDICAPLYLGRTVSLRLALRIHWTTAASTTNYSLSFSKDKKCLPVLRCNEMTESRARAVFQRTETMED